MPEQFNDVMIDIETAGIHEDAPIVSIAAAVFNPFTGEVSATFSVNVDLESSSVYGHMSASTIKWWMKQSDEARAIFNDPESSCLFDAMPAFDAFLNEHAGEYKYRKVWGNDETFDNVILRYAGEQCGEDELWPHWGNRCVRTMVDMGRRFLNINPKKTIEFTGTPHNALDDALHQVKYVSAIFQALQSKLEAK